MRPLPFVALALVVSLAAAQVSDPKAKDEDFQPNMYKDKPIMAFEESLFHTDATTLKAGGECRHNIDLLWTVESSYSVYSTPLITDLYSDGVKDVVVQTFTRYLEAFRGTDGHTTSGWPYVFKDSYFHASPILYDLDADGDDEIVVTTGNGEIVFLRQDGTVFFSETLKVSPLAVDKNWYVGLDEEALDASLFLGEETDHKKDPEHRRDTKAETFDAGGQKEPLVKAPVVSDEELARAAKALENSRKEIEHVEQIKKDAESQKKAKADKAAQAEMKDHPPPAGTNGEADAGKKKQEEEAAAEEKKEEEEAAAEKKKREEEAAKKKRKEEKKDEAAKKKQEEEEAAKKKQAEEEAAKKKQAEEEAAKKKQAEEEAAKKKQAEEEAAKKKQTEEEAAKKKQAEEEAAKKDKDADAKGETGDTGRNLLQFNVGGKGYELYEAKTKKDFFMEQVEESLELFVNLDPPPRKDSDSLFANMDPLFSRYSIMSLGGKEDPSKAYVDPHVLSTPAIADLDNDGSDEIILAVSYYYDSEYYSDPFHLSKVPPDVDITKFLAGGIVVFDIGQRSIKFEVHLDLTTTNTAYRSYMYSAPTVVDLDGDGFCEIVVGTSLGFVYVIDHKGNVVPGFPVEMAEIQAPITVADVNGDGLLDMVALDSNSNAVLFDKSGKIIWEQRVLGFATQAASVGDVNGDGILDVVFGTDAGWLYALAGDTGKILDKFPVKTGGKIMAQALLVRLEPSNPDPYIVVPSFDGYMYIVDGNTACADRVDLAETSFSMVLADDLTGDGKMELIASSMNGNTFVLGTTMPFEPLNSWPSWTLGKNGQTYRENYQGIYVLESSRFFRDIKGDRMLIQFEIVDNRLVKRPEYNVSISLGRMVLWNDIYKQPGVYSVDVAIINERRAVTVAVEMTNEYGQHFIDRFSVTLNQRFYKMLKWILVVPFFGMAFVLWFVRDSKQQATLPIF